MSDIRVIVIDSKMFQSTSSEEDVVSRVNGIMASIEIVSIHVLRRGRCVCFAHAQNWFKLLCFNPRPPKRTLCRILPYLIKRLSKFQSTSSEEDVVSGSV